MVKSALTQNRPQDHTGARHTLNGISAKIIPILLASLLTACGILGSPGGSAAQAQIASGITEVDGMARINSAAGAIDFQVSSGLSGERLPGVKLSVAVFGDTRMLYVSDPTGYHLPFAVPLSGSSTVRRINMPPKTSQGYNIGTADGTLNMDDMTPLGVLNEAELRAQLAGGPDEAVLIYLYNAERPLALTGASLQVFETPYDNVYVLRAAGEPEDAVLSLLIVGLNDTAYPDWEHRIVDRYLAGRIGLAADVDLRADLDFMWSYPVYEIYPPEPTLNVGTEETAVFRVSWRSENPDPPPPWSFVITAETEAVVAAPGTFAMGPDTPAQEIVLTINRAGLPIGDHTVRVFIQPYSEAFGLIEQTIEREVAFTVTEALPSPTPGPSTLIDLNPTEPREGDLLIISAPGFTPDEPVVIEFVGPEHNFRDALPIADDTGTFTYEINLDTVPAGTYLLRLTGAVSSIVAEQEVIVSPGIADAVVNTNELNLRTGPDYNYPVLELLVLGDELTVVGTNNDDTWIEVVTTTGIQGWVVTDLVDLRIDLSAVPWNPNVPPPP